MNEPDLVRRLTTIMDIDVVGFSTMSARDEEHALSLLNARMATARELVKHHRGRVFKLTGDGLLAEFASPVEAVRAGLEIQEAMRAANAPAAPDDQLVVRIGINLGDVVESGEDLLGDAVNVAARLESLAQPGGLCVSAAVYEQIEGKLTLGAEDMGEQHVRNIPRPIHAYRLTFGGTRPAAAAPATTNRKASRLAVILGGAAVFAILAIGGAWLLHQRSQPAPAASTAAQAPPPPAAATPSSTAATGAASSPPAPAAATATAPSSPPAPAATIAPATTASITAPPPEQAPAPRAYSAADVPFVPETERRRLVEYAEAENAKALAVNVRGLFAMATRRIDRVAARREALEACNARVERDVPMPREYDRCMLYAVDNEVVWTFRAPAMPPPPYVPAAKLSPPVPFDASAVPLVSERARRSLAEHYVLSRRRRAMVLGHNHFEWSSPSDTDADAIRRNLQSCGHLTGRPCVVYAVDDQVIVRVPQLHRVTNIFTPQDVANLDAGQHTAVMHYLIADDWRALAVGSNGRLGIVSGRPSETTAASEAMAECTKAGGENCLLLAVGPFVVDAR